MIAWLWARTVKSPNPAFAQVDVPLVSTFMLSTKAGKEAYVEPVIEGGGYRFTVKVGKPKDAEAAKNGTKLARGANFRCLMSGTPMAASYIKAEAKAGRMGARLMAIVAEGERGRVYLSPTPEHGGDCAQAQPKWKPDARSCQKALGVPRQALRDDEVARPLHPPPARGADDLLRPGAGSARAGEARRAAPLACSNDGKRLAMWRHRRHCICRCGGGVSGVCCRARLSTGISTICTWDQPDEQET